MGDADALSRPGLAKASANTAVRRGLDFLPEVE